MLQRGFSTSCSAWLIELQMQQEIRELKKMIEDFEHTFSEVQKESQARLREAEESQIKILQLQEIIGR